MTIIRRALCPTCGDQHGLAVSETVPGKPHITVSHENWWARPREKDGERHFGIILDTKGRGTMQVLGYYEPAEGDPEGYYPLVRLRLIEAVRDWITKGYLTLDDLTGPLPVVTPIPLSEHAPANVYPLLEQAAARRQRRVAEPKPKAIAKTKETKEPVAPRRRRKASSSKDLPARALDFIPRIDSLKESPSRTALERLETDMETFLVEVLDALDRAGGPEKAPDLQRLARRFESTAKYLEAARTARERNEGIAYLRALDQLKGCCLPIPKP